MSTLQNGLDYCEQNLKFPAINRAWSFRVQLPTAGLTATVPLPSLYSNPGQLNVVSPVLPYNSPQQGRRFLAYMMAVRDVASATFGTAGNLSGSGASSGGTVQIIDQAQSNAVVATLTSAASASPPQAQIATLTAVPVIVNPYEQMAVTFTQPVGATASATAFTVDLFGFWQGGI